VFDGQELIFDNIYPQGISRVEWIDGFYSPIQDLGQDFQITETVFARRQSGIPETDQEQQFSEFQVWIEQKFDVSYSQPWEKIIRFFSPDETTALQQFFVLFNECAEVHSAHPVVAPIAL
jgi:hypothetical protein